MAMNAVLKQAKILIVDDEISNVRLLEIVLEGAGFADFYSTTDPRTVLALFRSVRPDLVLLDLNMPHLDGFQVMHQLAPEMAEGPVPIIVLTADATTPTKHRALSDGASDFLTKPLDDVEVLLRIQNLLRTHFHSRLLEHTVQERTRDLELAKLETVQRLALAAEYRDDQTGLHARRVGIVSGLISNVLGHSDEQVNLMTQAAPLHDVGKIGIADAILLKRGPLTKNEFEVMKEHTVIGAKILSGSSSRILRLAEEIAMHHHERWNGTGYWSLAQDEIPLSGRIVAVADVFDALTHERPYKPAMPVQVAVDEIRKKSGSQFDANVVGAFMELQHDDLIGDIQTIRAA